MFEHTRFPVALNALTYNVLKKIKLKKLEYLPLI